MSIDDITRLLYQDKTSSEEWVRTLQKKLYELNPSRYGTNFNRYGADGDLGDFTRKDIIKFLEDNPAAILTLGDKLKENLINNNFGRKLIEIAGKDLAVQEILRAEIDNILEDKKLSELTTNELKTVQANWAILGEYNGKVDGIIGRKSEAAYLNHTRSGHIDYVPHPTTNPIESTNVAINTEYKAHEDSVIMHLIGGGEGWKERTSFDNIIRAIEDQGAIAPTIYETTSCGNGQAALDCMIGTIKEHVLANGTIDDLIIQGHGNTLYMGTSDNKYNLDLAEVLNEIARLEAELGIKITNRLTFSGCCTFSNLDNNTIKALRNWADAMDMEVVGTTSLMMSHGIFDVRSARWVQFTPNGEVIRDRLDSRWNPMANICSDHSWTDYHLGRPHEEAVAMMEKDRQAKEQADKALFEREYAKATNPWATGPKI